MESDQPLEVDGELRCSCSSHRLLGKVIFTGRRPYLEVVAHRAGKMLSQVRVFIGACEVICPACGRATRVTVRQEGVRAS